MFNAYTTCIMKVRIHFPFKIFITLWFGDLRTHIVLCECVFVCVFILICKLVHI